MATLAPCVCGCRKSKHRKTRMSVRLKSSPSTGRVLPSLSDLSRYASSASYYRVECGSCDCSDYLPDPGAL